MRFRIALAILLPMLTLGVAGTLERDDLTPKDLARVKTVTRPATSFSAAEPFEGRPGGAATTDRTGDANVLSHPSANLPFSDQQRFLVGNGLFRKDWISAPSSTLASTGLVRSSTRVPARPATSRMGAAMLRPSKAARRFPCWCACR